MEKENDNDANKEMSSADEVEKENKIKLAEDKLAEENYQKGLEFLNDTQGVRRNINIRKALEYFTESANMGHIEANFQLGYMYMFGEPYIMKNCTMAYNYFKKAADDGLVNAQFFLAECLMFALGIDKDEKKASDYYEKADKQGNLCASDRLCDIYMYGLGKEVDLDKALYYNSKTRVNGNFNAEIKYLSILKNKCNKK